MDFPIDPDRSGGGGIRGNLEQEQSIVSARGVAEKPPTIFDRVVTNEGQINALYKRIEELEDMVSQIGNDLHEALVQLGLT